MADQIIDILQRLTFDVDDKELKQAQASITANVNNINVLTQSLAKQQAQLNNTARNEVSKRKAITAAINNTKASIDKENKSLENNLVANKKVREAITQEIGLLGKLQKEMDVLRQKRDIATDPRKITAYSQQIANLNKQVSTLTGATGGGKGFLSSLGGGLLQGIGLGGGFAVANLAAQGIGAIKDFIGESSRLAAEAEGVERAFGRINSPDLLDNLRAATKGTVSDLELMKQAVQFSNFGLPIDKLGVALEFARRRAADTGQSVEYLVQSIVTGIGRQSPLILDNLGINAKRVADEFKRTGNFAEAAFKIIQEESKKAGKDLDTFAEQQARLNATIENQQAKVGKEFNRLYGQLQAEFLDLTELGLIDFLSSTNNANRAAFDATYDTIDKIGNAIEVEQEKSNTIFLQNFAQFTAKYETSDEKARKEIVANAATQYEALKKYAVDFYKYDLSQQQLYLNSLTGAYKTFNTRIAAVPINLNTLNPNDLSGMSKEQLEAVQEKIGNSRSALNAGDTAQIARLNKLSEATKKYLDIINGAKKTGSAAKEKKSFTLPTLGYDDEAFSIDKANIEALDFAMKRYLETLNKAFNPARPQDTSGIFDGAPVTLGGPTVSPQDPRNIDRALRIKDNEEAAAKAAEDEKTRLKESALRYIDYYEQIANAAQQAFALISQAQQDQYQSEISIREKRVEAATELAERGNTEALRIERERLNETLQAQEEAARRQQLINSTLALSYAVAAVAKAGLEGGIFAPATIAATIAAIVAGYAVVRSATSDSFAQGFKEGGYTGNKGVNEEAGVVHGQEFVVNAENTRKFRPMLELMNEGKMPVTNNYASRMEMGNVEKKLDSLIEAVEMSGTKVVQKVTNGQMALMVETYAKQQRRKYMS